MTINDIKAAHTLTMDNPSDPGGNQLTFLFERSDGAVASECDACGKNSKKGYTTLLIMRYQQQNQNTGAWSCSLSCCVTNAEAFLN